MQPAARRYCAPMAGDSWDTSTEALAGAEEICSRLDQVASDISDRILGLLADALRDASPEDLERAKSEERRWSKAQRAVAKAMAELGHPPSAWATE